MKELTFNRNSWHYRLVQWWSADSSFRYRDSVDICTYVWLVIKSTAFVAFMIVFTLGFSFGMIIGPLMGAVSWSIDSMFAGHFVVQGTFAKIFFGELYGITVLSIIHAVCYGVPKLYYWIRHRSHEQTDKPDNFLRAAYTKFKDKTCVKINFQ